MQGYTAGAVAVARAARRWPIGNERGTGARLDAMRHDPVWSGTGPPRGDGAPALLIPGWMAGERFGAHPIIDPAAGRHPDAEVVTVDASHSGILSDATTYRTVAIELAGLSGAPTRATPGPPQSTRAGRADT